MIFTSAPLTPFTPSNSKMKYDLSQELDQHNFTERAKALLDAEKIVELREIRPMRTLNQNSYLHLIIGYLGTELGETIEYVKEQYFKRHCNKDLFVISQYDKAIHDYVTVTRSTRDLRTDEMTTAIERFRNWCSKDLGIYIPEPSDQRALVLIEREVRANKYYL